MKAALIDALKEIAIRGGCTNHAVISSSGLGKLLGVSQQSASKRILELLEAGAITRELGVRKQVLKLTPIGIEILRKEYLSYKGLFESEGRLVIRGTVVTGFGEGQYYLNHKEYSAQFRKKLHYKPYEGTLNLKVLRSDGERLQDLRNMDGITIKGFRKHGRTFGDVKCFPSKIGNLECAVIFPLRSHYNDIIEIISGYHLRRTLGLRDGNEVKVTVET